MKHLQIMSALLLGIAAIPLAAQRETDYSMITAKDVADYRAGHEAQWRSRYTQGQPRLFYTPEQWTGIVERIKGYDGQGEVWRDFFYKVADRIVDRPVAAYADHADPQDLSEEWQRAVGEDMFMMALAAKLSDDPRYREKLREIVRTACAYPSWGKRNDDLAAGHITSGLAIAYDWHRDLFSPEEQETMRRVIRERVPHLYQALLGKKYWCNAYRWNHNHISIAGMGMAGLAFLDDIPEAGDWLAAALLDYQNIGRYSREDGGSVEGMGYWTYGRSFILQFIEATKNVTESGALYDQPFLRNAVVFRLASSTPGFHWVNRWGDGQGYDFWGPQHILYRLASQYQDGRGQYLGNHYPGLPHHGKRPNAAGWTLLWYDPSVAETPPGFLDYHAWDLDVITSRSGWGEGDYMLSVKAGVQNDAHTHLDAGAISLIMGQKWFLTTPGYGLGSHQPGFWERFGRRWTFFSNATESHSTLLINGQNQRFDKNLESDIDVMVDGPRGLWAEVDLDGIYTGVRKARRAVIHRRNAYVLVLDRVNADEPVEVEWLAQADPSAAAEGGALQMASPAGSMRLHMLDEGMPFEPRQPVSKNVDVSPRLLKTYAAKTRGAEVNLAALGELSFAGQEPEKFQTRTSVTDGIRQVDIETPAWRDRIIWRPDRGKIVEGAVEANARGLAVGMEGKAVVSTTVVDATRIASSPIEMESTQPFHAVLDAMGANGWILRTAGAGVEKLSVRDGMALFDGAGHPLEFDGALPPGRYFLASDATKALKLCESLNAQMNASRASSGS